MARFQYTGKDFETLYNELIQEIQTNFAEASNDFTESNLGIMFVDLVAFGLDTLSWYQDFQAGEVYITEATLHNSVVRIAKQLGYYASGAVPAAVDLTFTIPAAVSYDIPISKRFQFNGSTYIWETAENVTLLASQTEFTFTVKEGVTVEERFVSDGTKNQIFNLGQLPSDTSVSESELLVFVENEAWEVLQSLEYRADKIVEIQPQLSPPQIIFGNSVAGQIPPDGAEIRVIYFASHGVLGNDVETGSIQSSVVPLVVNNSTIDFTVTNNNTPSGGSDGRSTEEIRRLAPEIFRSQDAAVTKRDIIALSEAYVSTDYGAVSRASSISVRSADDDSVLTAHLQDLQDAINANDDTTDLATLSTIEGMFAGTERDDTLAATDNIDSELALQGADFTTALGYEQGFRDDVNNLNAYNDFEIFTHINTINALTTTELVGKENAAVQENIGTGTAAANDSFSATLTIPTDSEVAPNSISVRKNGTGTPTSGTEVATDNGGGVISGTNVTGSIDYLTGQITVTETAAEWGATDTVDIDFSTYSTSAGDIFGSTSAISSIVRNQSLELDSSISTLDARVTTLMALLTIMEDRYDTNISTEVEIIRGIMNTLSSTYQADFDTALTNISTRQTTVNADLATVKTDLFNYVDTILSHDCKSNVVEVAILTLDSNGFYTGANSGLVDELKDYLDARKEPTVTLNVTSGEALLIGAEITIDIAVSDTLIREDVKLAVEEAVDAVLKGKDFGADLRISNVYNTVTAVSGVSYAHATITGPGAYLTSDGDLVIPNNLIITKGTVTITVI